MPPSGIAPSAHVATGRGTGAGMGFRGGRGKPGYPVPPEMFQAHELTEIDDPGRGTFFGLKIPIEVSRKIAVPGGEPAERLHVTLFWNDSLTDEQRRLVRMAAGSVAHLLPVSVTLGGTGRFSASGSSEGKDVFYLSVDSPELSRLREEMAVRLRELGVEPDASHGYTPHVTLKYLAPDEPVPVDRIDPITIALEELILEAKTKPKMPDRISHLDDLEPEEFIAWLRKFHDLPLQGKLRVTEKVDGSARMTFGMEDGRLWTQSKSSPRRYSSEEWGDRPMFRALRKAHAVLEDQGPALHRWFQGLGGAENDNVALAEVLYTRVPNAIEYGPNMILVHEVLTAGGADAPEPALKDLESLVPAKISSEGEEWRIECRRTIDPGELRVDVQEEFSSLEDVLKKLYAVESEGGPALRDRFRTIQVAVKDKLLKQLVGDRRSAYGPEDGFVEGLVFKDLESGAMVKLVDKEIFTKLNQFVWRYRQLLDRGMKIGDEWRVGVIQRLRDELADGVLGSRVAKTPGFVSYVVRNFKDDLPASAGSPEERADAALGAYVEHDGVLKQGGRAAVQGFRTAIDRALMAVAALEREWDAEKSRGSYVDLGGRQVKMDEFNRQRTDDAFDDVSEALAAMEKGLEVVGAMDDDLTMRVALVKLSMGRARLEKLQSALPGPAQGLDEENFDVKQVRQKYDGKLVSHGIDVSKELGSGAHGTAYELGDGRVLKITNDRDEARAAKHIEGKSFKHIAKVFEVFRFPAPAYAYGVVQEKVKPLSPDEEKLFTWACVVVDDIVKEFIWDDWEIVKEDVLSYAKDVDDPGLASGARRAVTVLEGFGVPGILKDLKSAGIEYGDLHGGNVGRRGNDFVVFDLGNSDSPGKEPDVIERIVREAVISVLGEDEDDSPETRKLKDRALRSKEARDVMTANRDRLARRGWKIPEHPRLLGVGSRGAAYDIGNGHVLKITNDETEARAAEKIKGKNMKRIFRVFDVFQFKGLPVFGVVQEKLEPLPMKDAGLFDWAVKAVPINHMLDDASGYTWDGLRREVVDFVKRAYGKMDPGEDRDEWKSSVREAWRLLVGQFELKGFIDDLHALGIGFSDFHSGNIMARPGGGLVLIDLGYSEVKGGKAPDVLEAAAARIVELLEGQKPDTVGVTIGRFQPFHKGHGALIRKLAAQFTKVVVLVAGNRKDPKNPFSYDLRLETMEKSLPDVWSKVEVHRAEADGKATGFVPGILAGIVDDGSTIKGDTAVNVLVGRDRSQAMKQQFDRSKDLKAQGKWTGAFDPDLAVVAELPDVDDDSAERISGTRVREAIAKGDEAAVRSLMDPHLVSNEEDFKKVYAEMRDELGAGREQVAETLKDVGGEPSIDRVIQTNAVSLKSKKGISAEKLQKLGNGEDGVAYDMGGGRVFKVTTDKGEAQSSQAVKGKNLKHIVQVFDVFQFKNTGGPTTEIYGIVLERLQKLTETEGDEYDKLSKWLLKKPVIGTLATYDEQQIMKAIEETLHDERYQQYGIAIEAAGSSTTTVGGSKPAAALSTRAARPGVDPVEVGKRKRSRADAEIQKEVGELRRTFEKYQMPAILADLKSVGIKFYDFHIGNLMKRGGDYVITDLGRSKSAGGVPPLFERIVEDMLAELAGGPGLGSGIGGSMARTRGDSSAWSSPSMVKNVEGDVEGDDEKEGRPRLWQDNLKGLPIPTSGHPDERSGE